MSDNHINPHPGNSTHFNGGEGRSLSQAEAAAHTALFRKQYPRKTRANFYGREIIQAILDQPGCMGIRIYHAVNPANNDLEVLLIGADRDQNDMLRIQGGVKEATAGSFAVRTASAAAATGQQDGTIAGDPRPCPNCCGTGNELNGD